MHCPNCEDFLQEVLLDDQTILHCSHCGSSFFEENSINRISVKTAKLLEKDKKNNIIIGKQKICPKDGSAMQTMHEDSIPQTVILFHCPTCRGVFTYPHDLVEFKVAQNVKIKFFKVWNSPLPSLKAVLVLSVIALFGATITANLVNKHIYNSNAADVVSNVYISHSGRYLFVSFKTPVPMKSQIEFTDSTNDTKITEDVSTIPTTLHMKTVSDVDYTHDVYYQLILTDAKGTQIKSPLHRLQSDLK